jgi:hypothetical protein
MHAAARCARPRRCCGAGARAWQTMHVARGIRVGPGDIGGERLDQGDREIAGGCRGLGQISEIKRACLAGLCDRARCISGDDAGRCLGARECCFKIEHVLEIGSIIADRAHGGARQHGSEQRGESSAHDARDLIILFRPCQSQALVPTRRQVGCAANMHCSRTDVPLPFGACVLYLRERKGDPGGDPWP